MFQVDKSTAQTSRLAHVLHSKFQFQTLNRDQTAPRPTARMSISSNTLSELRTTVTQVEFLLSVPDIRLKTLSSNIRTCSICQEPFDRTPRRVGETANWPVKISCGHVFGGQCLTRLVFCVDGEVRCPLCRAMFDVGQRPSTRAWEAVFPILQAMTDTDRPVSDEAKTQVLEMLRRAQVQRRPAGGMCMDRMMIIYEELLSRFSNLFPESPSPATSDTDRLVAAEEQVQELFTELRLVKEDCAQRIEAHEKVAAAKNDLVRANVRTEVFQGFVAKERGAETAKFEQEIERLTRKTRYLKLMLFLTLSILSTTGIVQLLYNPISYTLTSKMLGEWAMILKLMDGVWHIVAVTRQWRSLD